MRVLIASTESEQQADGGGTAFVHALASGLVELGHDARLALPCRESMALDVRPCVDGVEMPWTGRLRATAFVRTGLVGGVYVYAVGMAGLSRPNTLCREHEFFAAALYPAICSVRPEWTPDVVHISDTAPGISALYLNVLCAHEWAERSVAVVTTVHGPACQTGGALTFVMGTDAESGMRVIRKDMSPSRLAEVYEPVYAQALASWEPQALAA